MTYSASTSACQREASLGTFTCHRRDVERCARVSSGWCCRGARATTRRGWLTEVEIADVGIAQAHLPTPISVDRIVETDIMNIGSVALRQIRQLIAELLEI